MGTSKRRQVPPDLVRGQKRFQAWRGRRKKGARIPQSLWAIATRLAKTHGVSRTAEVLGLDYYALKDRVDSASEPQSSGQAFVELTTPVMVGKQCRFELDNGVGGSMSGQLVGYDAADLEALARGFWNDR